MVQHCAPTMVSHFLETPILVGAQRQPLDLHLLLLLLLLDEVLLLEWVLLLHWHASGADSVDASAIALLPLQLQLPLATKGDWP